MNNKCCNGCDQGFVPVNANWDFNMEREDCECQNRARTTACGCEEKKSCECQGRTRTTTCGCEEKASCQSQASARNISCVREAEACVSQRRNLPAMVKAEEQELGEMYQAEAALKAGTLFPELHKPMRGYCPEGGLCHDSCQAEAFMLWELRLYLNTHPDDQEAMALFRHLCKDACDPNYATAFLTEENCAGWAWAKNPWPWEIEFNGCNCVKEGHGHVCV